LKLSLFLGFRLRSQLCFFGEPYFFSEPDFFGKLRF
jgi:hypothetical protein